MYKDSNISGLDHKTVIAISSIKDSSRVVCLPFYRLTGMPSFIDIKGVMSAIAAPQNR